jgi:hypothetical protein
MPGQGFSSESIPKDTDTTLAEGDWYRQSAFNNLHTTGLHMFSAENREDHIGKENA